MKFHCSLMQVSKTIYASFTDVPKHIFLLELSSSWKPNGTFKTALHRQMKAYPNYYKVKAILKQKKSISSVKNQITPIVDDRFKDNSEIKLAPNRYKVPGRDVSDLANKTTGKKGPYSCFSVARDDSTIIRRGSKSNESQSATMIYELKGNIHKLLHPKNYFILKIRHGWFYFSFVFLII